MADMWTLDELVHRVAATLADAEYPGAPNGRVRDVPNRRVIRWYTTIGLVDRPAVMRGRSALYGQRHLLQLVAVKRRQAEGRSLAEIQAELAGADDNLLRRVAGVPDELLATGARGVSADAPAAAAASPTPVVRPRFWSVPPRPTAIPGAAAGIPAAAEPPEVAEALEAADAPGEDPDSVTTLSGVPLAGGALLLVPARPRREDIAAIQAAARPLLDLLADRGLLAIRSTT